MKRKYVLNNGDTLATLFSNSAQKLFDAGFFLESQTVKALKALTRYKPKFYRSLKGTKP